MDREKAKWYDPSYMFVEFAYEKQFIEKNDSTKINLNH